MYNNGLTVSSHGKKKIKHKTNYNSLIGEKSVMISQKDHLYFSEKGCATYVCSPQKMSCCIPTCLAIIGIYLEGFSNCR